MDLQSIISTILVINIVLTWLIMIGRVPDRVFRFVCRLGFRGLVLRDVLCQWARGPTKEFSIVRPAVWSPETLSIFKFHPAHEVIQPVLRSGDK